MSRTSHRREGQIRFRTWIRLRGVAGQGGSRSAGHAPVLERLALDDPEDDVAGPEVVRGERLADFLDRAVVVELQTPSQGVSEQILDETLRELPGGGRAQEGLQVGH